MPAGMTLTKFFLEKQRKIPETSGKFTRLLADLATAAKVISREVNKAGLLNILGTAGYSNVQGEEVQKLDEYANSVMIGCMEHGGYLSGMASEEMENVYEVPEVDLHDRREHTYLLVFDPLDGSSNIDVNISIGTIFSILRKKNSRGEKVKEEDFFQPGTEQVCAGYIIYGSSTVFVYTSGHGVHGFTLDPTVGEFILSHENIRTPEKGSIYSINEGNCRYWYPGTSRYIEKLKNSGNGKGISGRYVGSLVADFHRNLIKGGIFLYPKDQRSKNGKLRLLYEANPLAFIVEQAGGAASTGEERIMEVIPKELHQRIPLIIGSKDDVLEAERYWQDAGDSTV